MSSIFRQYNRKQKNGQKEINNDRINMTTAFFPQQETRYNNQDPAVRFFNETRYDRKNSPNLNKTPRNIFLNNLDLTYEQENQQKSKRIYDFTKPDDDILKINLSPPKNRQNPFSFGNYNKEQQEQTISMSPIKPMNKNINPMTPLTNILNKTDKYNIKGPVAPQASKWNDNRGYKQIDDTMRMKNEGIDGIYAKISPNRYQNQYNYDRRNYDQRTKQIQNVTQFPNQQNFEKYSNFGIDSKDINQTRINEGFREHQLGKSINMGERIYNHKFQDENHRSQVNQPYADKMIRNAQLNQLSNDIPQQISKKFVNSSKINNNKSLNKHSDILGLKYLESFGKQLGEFQITFQSLKYQFLCNIVMPEVFKAILIYSFLNIMFQIIFEGSQ